MQHTAHHLHRHLFFGGFIALAALLFATRATAASYTTVDVRIEASGETFYHETVFISDEGCTVTDTTGTERQLTGDVALCALDLAAEQGGFSYALSYYDGFGLLLDQIDTYGGDLTSYWLYYVNDQMPSVGLGEYDLSEGDELLLTYGGYELPLRLTLDRTDRRVGGTITVKVEYYAYDYVATTGSYQPVAGAVVHVGDTMITTDTNGKALIVPEKKGTYTVYAEAEGYTKTATTTLRIYKAHEEFDSIGRDRRQELINEGVKYLLDRLDENGLVDGSQSMTEWAAMALASAHQQNKKLFTAVKEYRPTSSDGTTEIARHILALEAMGLNARDFRGADFVERLQLTMVNGQFGSESYCNDDIFAVLALIAADAPASSEAVKQGAQYSLNCVTDDGGVSFAVSGSPDIDTTAAWLMMAARLKGKKDELGFSLSDYRYAAVNYLRAHQNPDGGWGYQSATASNSSTTAWVLQSLRARRHEAKAMTTNHQNGFHFLNAVQDSDRGAMRYDTAGSMSVEALNTAYSILAIEGQPLPVNKSAKLRRKHP